jgi:hypothetical protein
MGVELLLAGLNGDGGNGKFKIRTLENRKGCGTPRYFCAAMSATKDRQILFATRRAAADQPLRPDGATQDVALSRLESHSSQTPDT